MNYLNSKKSIPREPPLDAVGDPRSTHQSVLLAQDNRHHNPNTLGAFHKVKICVKSSVFTISDTKYIVML